MTDETIDSQHPQFQLANDDDSRPVVFGATDIVAGYRKDVDIVRGATLCVRQGQVVCIVGPNGAGKSTLIRALFGLVKVRSGSVMLNGTEITGISPHKLVREGVGYVPQVNDVFPTLTVHENLRMGLPASVDRHEAVARMAEILALFPQLVEHRRKRAGTLSGGQRRMLSLARALMSEPDLLLLDEPSAGLSPRMAGEIFAIIAGIRDAGVSVAMVEQNAHMGLGLADWGYVLDQGKERLQGRGSDLLEDRRVRRMYLGAE